MRGRIVDTEGVDSVVTSAVTVFRGFRTAVRSSTRPILVRQRVNVLVLLDGLLAQR